MGRFSPLHIDELKDEALSPIDVLVVKNIAQALRSIKDIVK
jgi:hypothetical protein